MGESDRPTNQTMTFPSLVRYREAWQAPSTPQPSARPGVRLSAVLVVHNGGREIGTLVSELFALTRPFLLQVIVVDDASTDETGAVLSAIGDARLDVITQPERAGAAQCIRQAVESATGTHVCVIDLGAGLTPEDLGPLVTPLTDGDGAGTGAVVFSTRPRGIVPATKAGLRNPLSSLAAHAANVIFDADLLDLYPAARIFPQELLKELTFSGTGYQFDTELVGEVLRRHLRPIAVACVPDARHRGRRRPMSPTMLVRCLTLLVRVRRRGLITLVESAPAPGLDPAGPNGHHDRNGAIALAEGGEGGTAPLEGLGAGTMPVRRRGLPIWRWAVIFVIAAAVVVTLLQFPGKGVARSLGLSPPIEKFTELYFPQTLTLPAVVTEGKPLSFSFGITNEQGRSETYDWLVQVTNGTRTLTLTAGSTTIAADRSSQVSLEVSGLHSLGASTISVIETSTSPSESIFFHVTVKS